MKNKITLLLILLFATSFASQAQMVSSSSLIITKERKKLPPVKPGLQQSVEVGTTVGHDFVVGADYVIGYRFNNTFFLGGGVGFGYNIDDYVVHFDGGYYEGHKGRRLSNGSIEFPVFVNTKIYFLKTRCTPYFGLSAGAAFSPKATAQLDFGDVKYNTIGALVVPSLGVNVRINARYSLYAAAKVRMRTFPFVKDVNATDLTTAMKPGFSFGACIGFTF